MKNQDTKDTTKNNDHPALQTQMDEDLCLNPAGIDEALKKICGSFSSRVGIADIEILSFCLRHIFYNTNQIYTLLLPELTVCTTESTEIENDHFHARNMPMRNMPIRNVNIQYRIWSSLKEIEATLERLEPLCQLIISATTNILNELDRTCSIHTTTQYTETQTQTRPGDEQQTANASHIQSNDQNILQQGLAHIIEKMNTKKNRLSFSVQFAILAPMIPALSQIDAALDTMFKSIYAIFGDILPNIPDNRIYEDESSATVLLDLIQRCDQIVLQLALLAEPLHVLTGQYTLETALQ
jgi:hypothetical protein